MHVKFAAQYENTRFLALDKGIRPHEFIEILKIPGQLGPLTYDEEWVRVSGLYSCTSQFGQYFPI